MRIKDKYINPFTDFGFKKLFGSDEVKDLLIAFLNTLLPEATGTIVSLAFLPLEQVGRSEFDRKAIYDLYCENENGDKFIVEMQSSKQMHFKDRSVFYATFPIQRQALKGDWNFKLKAVYMVGILDFVFDEDKSDDKVVHHEVKLVDSSTGKVFFDKLTFIYLELPKFHKKEEELVTEFDKWCYLLRNLPNLSARPSNLDEEEFQKAFDIAEIAAYSDSEYAIYEDSLKVYRDLRNIVDTAYDEGLIEGEEIGMAKGEEIGMAKMVRRMHDKGTDLGKISEISGLTIDEIEGLMRDVGRLE